VPGGPRLRATAQDQIGPTHPDPAGRDTPSTPPRGEWGGGEQQPPRAAQGNEETEEGGRRMYSTAEKAGTHQRGGREGGGAVVPGSAHPRRSREPLLGGRRSGSPAQAPVRVRVRGRRNRPPGRALASL